MATDTRIGTAIKRARERMRWTQRQLADAVGVNVKTVDNWEGGRTSPRNRRGALEEVLGISLYEDEPAPAAPELTATDAWEQSVLDDRHLDGETKRWLIQSSRDARLAYVAARRERRAAGQEAARSDRGTAAG